MTDLFLRDIPNEDIVLVVLGYDVDDTGYTPITLHVIPSTVRRAALAMTFPRSFVDAYARFTTRSVMGVMDTLRHRHAGIEKARRYHERHAGMAWPPIRMEPVPPIAAADVYARAALEFVPWWFYSAARAPTPP
jgi:hypothetical protein